MCSLSLGRVTRLFFFDTSGVRMHYARGLKGRCFGSVGILYRKCLWCGNLFRRIELADAPPEIPIQQPPTKKLELGPGSD